MTDVAVAPTTDLTETGDELDHLVCCHTAELESNEPTFCGITITGVPVAQPRPGLMCVVCTELAATLICPRTQSRCTEVRSWQL